MRLLLAATLAAAVAADQCSVVQQRAPCGQAFDTEDICLAKGCCYDASDSTVPCFYPGADAVPIKTVYVIQSCHFDAGFANTLVNIVNLWFDTHFPNAYAIGSELAAMKNTTAGLKFMAQSWIVSLYTNCPPNSGLNCPSPAALANFTEAVTKGYIHWHAFPFNAELELLDPSLLAFGVNMTNELDDAFGVRRKTVLSQRDVPGMSRAGIPVLKAAGVRAVTVGVNGASTPPSVPRAFNWLDPVSNETILAMWHPRGYGGITFEDAIVVPGLDTALVPDWMGDNAGPEPLSGILSDWVSIGKTFPGAQIVPVTWEEWVDKLQAVAHLLPTITTEIGETWIHGAPSDPHKQAWFKNLQRLRTACLESGDCDINDPAFRNFSRLAIKSSEHTDGKDVKTYLHDATNWSNQKFQAALASNLSNFNDIIASWYEQRAWSFDYPMQALPDGHPLKAQLEEMFAQVYPPAQQPTPTASGWSVAAAGHVYSVGPYNVAFDAASGAISHLASAASGQAWATGNPGELLGVLEYQTYDQSTYDTFIANYYCCPGSGPAPSWFMLDFGKPNVSLANPVAQNITQSLTGIWTKATVPGVTSFLVQSQFLDSANGNSPHVLYGAPETVWTQFDFPSAAGSLAPINITVSLYNKTATRLPEALFVRFNTSWVYGASAAPSQVQWLTDIYGEWVDPYVVQSKGNQKHHGALSGIKATIRDPAGAAPNATLMVYAPDTPVANFGAPFGLPTPTTVPDDRLQGAAFLLSDNTWGTNYVMWTPFAPGDENIAWRFQLAMQ